MKVDISAEGVLTIRAETEIESYALRKWGDENYGKEPNMLICTAIMEK